jgi:hypothetical protein
MRKDGKVILESYSPDAPEIYSGLQRNNHIGLEPLKGAFSEARLLMDLQT